MPIYNPPLDDIRFVLNEVLKAGALAREIPDYAEADWDTIGGMLEAVSEFARDVAFPLNQSGDKEQCTYNPADKSVKTPKGFDEAYQRYAALGLIGMSADPAYGGMGMPQYLNVAASEMLTAANFSLSSYPGLTGGAYKALHKFASDELKDIYLPKMLSGEWSGTMCLTEPQAGSDLGLIRTKAVPQDDGSHAITGNKIFITCGEHDLTRNICHLVLARLPDAPEGVKGISLFVVPKFLPDASGEPGARNPAFCTGIEHKMGINASSTCSMSFEGAKGWLVGEPHKGMKAMFMMMNDARLKVGMQGLGLSEIAWQNAAAYASERVQGKALKDFNNPDAKSVAIINHASVRRHLMDMKAQIDGFRALAYDVAIRLDLAAKHPEPTVRRDAEEYAGLMTPILKSCLSDLSCAAAQRGIQLHGGMGFINETGVNQYYRDSIIATIYEGTNDIQAMDFTFRKVLDFNDHMNRLGLFMAPLTEQVEAAKNNPATAEAAKVMEEGIKIFQNTCTAFMQLGMAGKLDEIHAQADHFLNMTGRLAVGSMWLKMADAARESLAALPENDGKAAFYRTKLALSDHYFTHIMRPDMKRMELLVAAGAAFLGNISREQQVPGSELGIAKTEAGPDNRGHGPFFTF